MKKWLKNVVFMLMVVLAFPVNGAVRVFATLPEWGALAQEIGGERVEVFVATSGLQDPHRIQARPSLIAKARSADMLVLNGAELEIGWLPQVIQSSGNPRIQFGQPGYFEAARHVALRDIPARIDRAQGDIHPDGNPHILGDPRNMLLVGEALSAQLSRIDPENAPVYREGYRQFAEKMRTAIAAWEKAALPLKNVPILVQHKSFSYLEHWLGLIERGALEPIPGVEPSSAHLSEIAALQTTHPARMVIYLSYQHDAPSRWISERARIPAVLLPATVGGTQESGDLFLFYEDTIRRLLKAIEG